MSDRVIIGTITMPYGVSNKETLVWLEEWLMSLSNGINSFSTIAEVVFFEDKYIKETLSYLINSNNVTGWHQSGFNELLSPTGNYIKIIHDEESGKILKELKNGN